jgi:hypothetical protein
MNIVRTNIPRAVVAPTSYSDAGHFGELLG